MQNRRNFLKQASLMLAGGLVAPQLLSSCGGKSGQAAATASESSKYIGQLYSLRDLVKKKVSRKYWKPPLRWVIRIWRQQAMITVRFTV